MHFMCKNNHLVNQLTAYFQSFTYDELIYSSYKLRFTKQIDSYHVNNIH